MSEETTAPQLPPSAKLSLGDLMDDPFDGAEPLFPARDVGGNDSLQPFVSVRASKLKTMIRSIKSSLKSTNRYSRFDTANIASLSPVSRSSRAKLVSLIFWMWHARVLITDL
jgi:hypothetical protein